MKFEIKTYSKIPNRMLVGQGRVCEPLYSPLTVPGYQACIRYLDESERYLLGHLTTPPGISNVLENAIPHGAILAARLRTDGYVDVVFEDADRGEERSPRILDPHYLVVLILLTLPGGSIRFNDSSKGKSKGKRPEDRRLFLSFGRGADQNIALLRIIYGASVGHQIHRIHSSTNALFHYDYRRAFLKEVGDSDVRNTKRKARHSERGRNAAIEAACKHLTAAKKYGRTIPEAKLTGESFKLLLERAMSVADKLDAALNNCR